jgi:hypothetical protein
LVRAGVEQGPCESLLGSAPQGSQEYSISKRPTFGLVTRGTLVGFSFAEMKSGLGNKEKGKGKGALRDAYGFGTRCTPERTGSSGFKPTLCPGCEIIQRQISCHTTRRRQRSTGKIGQFPRAARGPTRRTWEADINLESLGPESGCDLSSSHSSESRISEQSGP